MSSQTIKTNCFLCHFHEFWLSMDIRDLRYFIVCAELGHMQRAAERIGRTQPALTKAVRRLEAHLEARLFEPEGRGLRLTSVGEALLAHARRLVHGLNEATREVSEVAAGRIGHVRIGTGPTVAEWLLPGLFQRVMQETPDLTFEVTVGLGDVLRRSLREGHVDFILVPLLEDDTVEFTATTLGTDMMVVAGRSGHPLARREVTCRDLGAYRWMLPASAMTSRRWVQSAFLHAGLPPPVVQMEVSTVTVLRRVVAKTDLLTFVSRRDLAGGPGGTLQEIAVRDLVLERRFGMLRATGGYIPVAAQCLMALLQSEAAAFLNDSNPPGDPQSAL
jgi:DNA-binding transcriptional LysR family regulator